MGLQADIGVDSNLKLDSKTGKAMAKRNKENYNLFAEKLEQLDSDFRYISVLEDGRIFAFSVSSELRLRDIRCNLGCSFEILP